MLPPTLEKLKVRIWFAVDEETYPSLSRYPWLQCPVRSMNRESIELDSHGGILSEKPCLRKAENIAVTRGPLIANPLVEDIHLIIKWLANRMVGIGGWFSRRLHLARTHLSCLFRRCFLLESPEIGSELHKEPRTAGIEVSNRRSDIEKFLSLIRNYSGYILHKKKKTKRQKNHKMVKLGPERKRDWERNREKWGWGNGGWTRAGFSHVSRVNILFHMWKPCGLEHFTWWYFTSSFTGDALRTKVSR